MDTQAVHPFVVETGNPVAARQSVLDAGEDREPLVDVAVDEGELRGGVSVAKVLPPTPQHGVEIGNDIVKRQACKATVGPLTDLAPDRGDRSRTRPLLQIPTTPIFPGLPHPIMKAQEVEGAPRGAMGKEMTDEQHLIRADWNVGPGLMQRPGEAGGHLGRGIACCRVKRPDNVTAGRHCQTPACVLARPKGRAKANWW
jgi:hypothetical protein